MTPWELKPSFADDIRKRREHVQSILEQHDSARWNDWPKMPIAELNRARITGATSQLLFYAGQHGITHSITTWPEGMLENLPWQHVTFIPESLGNTPHGFSQNLLCVFVIGDDLYVVTLGCDHEFEVTRTGNCYRERTCTKCNYTYGEDSSG